MTEGETILVFGAGGHAKVIIDLLERSGRFVIGCVVDDDSTAAGRLLLDRYRVAGGREVALAQRSSMGCAIVAIGRNAARRKVFDWLHENGYRFAVGVHPCAVLGSGVGLGPGTVVMAGTVVNADSGIGSNCILNTGARIDHDCVVEDHVHVAPGVVLCGGVTVGTESFIGAGAVIVPGVRVGARVTIGAGSTVLNDIPDDTVVAGSPARDVKGSYR